jgi:hypothetical protein
MRTAERRRQCQKGAGIRVIRHGRRLIT